MAKVITDTFGFAHAIQRQFGCDRQIIEQLIEQFSENVVIAGDRYAVANQIVEIARKHTGFSDWGDPASVKEDPDIDFNRILDRYRDTDQDEVGYTYYALREAVLEIYTETQCEEFVQRSL